MRDSPKAAPIVRDARFVAAASSLAQLPAPAFAEVAFAGKSNVGKSTLINTLVNRNKLVRTSSTPGCTRTINLFRIEMQDAVLDFVDLPGYGFAKRSKSERRSWGALIETFLEQRAGLRVVVVLVDVRRGLDEDTAGLLEYLKQLGLSIVLVATKIDKLPRSQQKSAVLALKREAHVPVVGFSALARLGIGELWSEILRVANVDVDGRLGVA